MRNGEIFIVVRAYLDSSGKTNDSFVTLAAVVANDTVWAGFEQGWNEILSRAFLPVTYIHMIEAVHLQYEKPFSRAKGWTTPLVWKLIMELVQYMSTFKDGQLSIHSCEVDMNAWRKLTNDGYVIPSEVDLCNAYVSDYIVGLLTTEVLGAVRSRGHNFIKRDVLLNFVFDRNEAFIRPFSKKVNAQKDLCDEGRISSIWQFVDSIAEGEMRTTPGLQAADIVAWGINRGNTASEGKQGKMLSHVLRQIVRTTWKTFDERSLKRAFPRLSA